MDPNFCKASKFTNLNPGKPGEPGFYMKLGSYSLDNVKRQSTLNKTKP